MALNLADQLTRAEIEDGTTLSGANDVSLTAASSHTVETTTEAGASAMGRRAATQWVCSR